MNVNIYVEGRSDKEAMEALLAPLLEQKHEAGVYIEFLPVVSGDRKATLLTKIPLKAAQIVLGDPDAIVIAVPDLYPRNKGFDHSTFQEIRHGMIERFTDALRQRRVDDQRLLQKFHVFCFKHDLEVLLLANETALKAHLNVANIKRTWHQQVEDQNQDHPPKMVIQDLFKKHGRTYCETVDAPRILRECSYLETAEYCPQCFKPFVAFLASL